MIIYRIGKNKVILNVSSPDDLSKIQIENNTNDEALKWLKEDFEKGWYGIHGNLQFLETTAIDLDHAARYHSFFSYLNPVLIEGQEILDAYEYDDTVMY